jgi:hypothetical protein
MESEEREKDKLNELTWDDDGLASTNMLPLIVFLVIYRLADCFIGYRFKVNTI